MLSPRVFHLLLRHLDSIDEVLSSRFKRKRPYQETHLTALLCDLLDDDTSDEKTSYPREELRRDLGLTDESVQMSIKIDTHEYTPDVERWVTQSDLGLIVKFRDFIEPVHSHSTAWLLQAKRLEPQLHSEPMYSDSSRFGGADPKQHQRIIALGKVIGVDFIRYLLYCPRPNLLAVVARAVLARQRVISTSGRIFDYLPGLEMHNDLMSTTSTLAAGTFVAPAENPPNRLRDAHRRVAEDTPPFSWFILRHFVGDGRLSRNDIHLTSMVPISPHTENVIFDNSIAATVAHAIVSGDPQAVDLVQRQLEFDGEFRFLPPHTMVIEVSVGQGLNLEGRAV